MIATNWDTNNMYKIKRPEKLALNMIIRPDKKG
jgi:hypothetical protein